MCITAMISDLHLFYGMAGMRIVSRLEKSCASNREVDIRVDGVRELDSSINRLPSLFICSLLYIFTG